ncbi:lycopene beta-cyclase [Kineococcus xinjiangensis]|uniref:Lycopene beta-cyclase n=1 Tax=Kineococcus xinjiangensis TaxID=512762 RepID=A0A2S6IJ95_9ACTN|nr:lycopene cyclase family protein [Kineococcus xinjiangensis]PPK94289.1 lycopene beta-cyclase [Kineococcus xinjiangensis]
MEELTADVALVGLGAAGGSLLRALVRDGRARAGRRPLRVVAVEAPSASARRSASRSWCTWGPPGWRYEGDVAARWSRVRVVDGRGGVVEEALDPLEYRLVRSGDFEAAVAACAAGAEGVELRRAEVLEVADGVAGASVRARADDGGELLVRARWALDSRPPALPVPGRGRTVLLQHFRGWRVRTAEPVFDAGAATLMDFRVPQPARGTAFGYVLPTSAREALVEYTEFSRQPLTRARYEEALRAYLRGALGVGEFEVLEAESGVIPMTDVPFEPRAGRSVFRIGAAGGAVRPSTGYAFSAVQRQVDAVVAALAVGEVPVPPVPHRRRHLLMDAVVLRALDSGTVRGSELFPELFRRNGAARVLRFLDGRSTVRDEVRVMASAPRARMLRTVGGLALSAPARRRPAR